MRLGSAGRVVLAATTAGGVAVVVLVGHGWRDVSGMSSGRWLTAAAMTVLLVASHVRPLLLFRGRQSEAFGFGEACFVVMVLLAPPAATLLVFLVATTAVQILKRRPAVKATFNVGQVLLSVGLSLAVTRALVRPVVPLTSRDLAAASLGGAVYFLVNSVSVTGMMVATGSSWRSCALDGLGLRLALSGSAILAGDLLVLGIQEGAWTFAIAVPALFVLRHAVAEQFQAKYDRLRMQGLFDVTMDVTRQLQVDAVRTIVLRSVRQLLRCEDAWVADTPPAEGETGALMDVGGDRKWLVVTGRRREEPFDEADRNLLHALAAVGATALTNAGLYRQVRFERQRLSSIALGIAEGVCAVDLEGCFTFVNPAALELVHLPTLAIRPGDDVDTPFRAPDFLLEPAMEAIATGQVVRADDTRFPAVDGGTIPVSYTASPVLDGATPVGAVIAFRDITERKAFEDEMSQQALTDSLTGLPNRRVVLDRLDAALGRCAADGKTHALIFVDIDRFKGINDSLGHVTGDDLLVAIATRMREAVRSGDLLARFGGDEFVVLLEDIGGEGEALAAAERICNAVKRPLTLPDGYEIVASISAGVALTEPGKNADDVLHDADVAMYEAKVKHLGGAVQVFDTKAMGRRSSERLELEAELRKGIDRGELDVYYQPMFSIADERIVGAEALVRWQHPVRGLVEPGKFIALAEESGLILPLGRCVLERAAAQARLVRDRYGVDLPMSVNLSPRQFQETGLVRAVGRLLDDVHLSPSSITFEITESMLMDDLSGAGEVMKKLSALGVGLAVDDFGTGHSSLGYLKQFPIDEVKVDRLFVMGVSEHPVDTAIVRAVVQLAEAMEITAVAEGIETGEQLAGLRMLGCPIGQGFYFARPLPADAFERLLEANLGPARPTPQSATATGHLLVG